MSAPPPIPAIAEDRHGRILAELAGLSLELARDLQARALAAESAEDAAKLAAAFHRTARCVRQCLALEAKLVHDLAREARVAAEARLKRDHQRRHADACRLGPARPERERETLHDPLDAFEAFDDDLDELLVPPELRRAPADTPLIPATPDPIRGGTQAAPGDTHRVPTRPSAWAASSAGVSGGGDSQPLTPTAAPPPQPNSS
ncbi:hypothetical protein [Phenylobacterium sp.]|uniref:hypothetical protein n=1 Tax=Phenylobacterium sp. TaxID=1871053 RepID=UPI002BAA891D|nr:hypothetical protein [Phenylobacterium sp.]HVI34393.1 hypothetical protein [Phenylobacterium sp.]